MKQQQSVNSCQSYFLKYLYMQTISFLQQLGYSETEAKIFLIIYQYWPKPASSIASFGKLDRTYCYKVLNKFSNDGLIYETIKKWTKQFFVPNPEVLQGIIQKKQKEIARLDDQFLEIKDELSQFDKNKSPFIPKIAIFEWGNVVDRFYDDILQTIENRDIISISFFASHTFDSQVGVIQNFQTKYNDFIDVLKKNKVDVNWYIWEGILVMDDLIKMKSYEEIKKILPWQNSTYGYVVGSNLYILQFREIEVGLKIESLSMTDMFNFLLDRLK